MTSFLFRALAFFTVAVSLLVTPASAHISLQQPTAETASAYHAVLQVTHGCGGSATIAVSVQLPAGFDNPQPQAKAGWTLERRGNDVTWAAASKQAVLPPTVRGEFVIDGKLRATPAPLWFKVRQSCAQGHVDWTDLPVAGTSTRGMKTPAVLLQVRKPAAVSVEQAWVRPSVPGQQGSGGYMKLTAREGLRLVGAESSVAGVAQFHEMKMDGNVMTMRAAGAINLPAGKTVELKPGGLHLMLMDLKQPLAAGTSVPLTLVLQDGRGIESRVETLLLVSVAPPGAGHAIETHKH